MRRKRYPGIVLAAAIVLGLIPSISAVAAPAPPNSPADAGWPTIASGAGPKGIDFIDPARGWVAGAAGFVYRTTDGGTTWTPQWTGTRVGLQAVDFVDSEYGWAVGDDATVVVTHDGGTTWAAQVAPTGPAYPGMFRFTGVSFLDRQRGWAVNRYSVLKTVDGGANWSIAYDQSDEHNAQGEPLQPYDLRGVEFVDALHGWIVGLHDSYPMVLRTADGGVTWSVVRTGAPSSAKTVAMDFVDAMHGWSVGDDGIRATDDGGVTWRGQPLPPSFNTPYITDVSFSDRLHGSAVGLDTYRTDDGGATWVRLDPALRGGIAVVAVDAVHVRATMNGNVVLTSDDAGLTWVPHRTAASTTQTLNGVHFVDPQHGWVAGDAGVIRRTDDGGISWTDQVSGTAEPLHAIWFTDLLHGVAVGGLRSASDPYHGVILRTVDGGATWEPRAGATARPPWFAKVFFVDALHGWVAGGDGLQSTSDGGQTWVKVGSFNSVNDVFFFDLQHGAAISGGVHVTGDGGATWTVHNPLANLGPNYGQTSLSAVQFLDADHGWVAGSRVVSRTVDGGATWTATEIWTTDIGGGGLGTITDLAFQTASDGWVVTTSGYAFNTRDGGQTWRLVQTSASDEPRVGSRVSLSDLFFTDVTHGWSVGGTGTVVQVSNHDEALVALTSSPPADGRPVVLTLDARRRDYPPTDSPRPTGVVEFGQDGSVIGTAVIVDGQARVTTAPLTPGVHGFTARYLGDADFAPTPAVGLWVDTDKLLLAFHPLSPARIQDSRPGHQVGPYDTPWGPDRTRDVTVAGLGGVPADAHAVVLNVAVTATTSAGYLTVWPAGHVKPLASSLNWAAGQTISNAVTAKLGTGGQMSVFNPTGNVDVIVDVVGYYDDNPGDRFTSFFPVRIQDSRPSWPQIGAFNTPWGPNQTREVTVAGVGGVPEGADAVVLNLAVTGTTSAGYLTMWPAGQVMPLASSLNWAAGETISNAVTAKVGAGGSVMVFNPSGNVDVIVDVVGYYDPNHGHGFHPLTPERLNDSRPAGPQVGPYNTPWGPNETRAVTVAGVGEVPARAHAVVMNVAVTGTTSAGYLTIWPAGQAGPLASSLNWASGQTISNAVTSSVSEGEVWVLNRVGNAHVIVDVVGYFGPGPPTS